MQCIKLKKREKNKMTWWHYILMIVAGVFLAIVGVNGIKMIICAIIEIRKSKSLEKQNAVSANPSAREDSITLSSKQAADVMKLIESLAEIFKNER